MDESGEGDGWMHWRKANAELRCEEEVNLRLKVHHRKLQELVDELETRLNQVKERTKQAEVDNYDTCASINAMHAQIRETNARLRGLVKRIDLQKAKNKADCTEVMHRKSTLETLRGNLHENVDSLESVVEEWQSMRTEEVSNACHVSNSTHTHPDS